MKCQDCKIDYPEGYVQEVHFGSFVKELCAICALEFTNKFHGIEREKFEDGSKAEKLRQKAIEFRKGNIDA